jgi:large subunit ribosomal protein L19
MNNYHHINDVICGEGVMSDLLLKAFDSPVNEKLPQLHVGDNVTVYVRIVEGTRERTQMIRGIVIRLRRSGNQENFTVRRVASNSVGVELTFLTRSPRIEKIEIHRHAHVRRAQLYYLRNLTGKAARLREKRLS